MIRTAQNEILTETFTQRIYINNIGLDTMVSMSVNICKWCLGSRPCNLNSLQGNQDPSAFLTTIAPDPPSMSQPPNPESTGYTASNQTPIIGGDQQSLTKEHKD